MRLRKTLKSCAWRSGIAALLLSTLRADELYFPNGDRISGTVVSQTAETVVFNSPSMGQLTLPAKDLRVVLTATSAATTATTAPVPPEPESEAVAKSANRKPDKAKELEEERWKGKLELGFRSQDGRRESINFDFRASAERKLGDNNLKASARLLYGEQDEKINTERYDASLRWRRELSERTFAQTLTSYYRDPLKNIQNNWEQNVGAGLRIYKSGEHTVNVGAGLTAQYREAESSETSGSYALVELFQDYTYQISKRIKFLQNAVAQYSPDGQGKFISVPNQPSTSSSGESNYKVRFDSTLQGQLTDSISLNLRYEYEFDNAVVTEAARADQRITSSIGYGF